MRILIAVSSRHGGTYGIARRLRTALAARGHAATVMTIEGFRCPDGYDAYVVGAAVYMGRWMRAAEEFLHDNLATLRSRPLWLFSSGPLGDDADPADALAHPEDLVALTGARQHQVFSGRLVRKELTPFERVAATMTKAPEGDFRDWDAVDRWADSIDADLRQLTPA